ncbi:hypothetical protein Pint_27677 [Pistacia integerrima]|uniref:Uncharacterized protein n=1 Tax=Pistacia integerrima TaxID=434235 RepID=A0ACC0YQ10_9ROSI|nr:hypothetical protein Pint_27677 [Pistacia integerrima]
MSFSTKICSSCTLNQ